MSKHFYIFAAIAIAFSVTGAVAEQYINKNCAIEQTESSKEVQQ